MIEFHIFFGKFITNNKVNIHDKFAKKKLVERGSR